MSIRIDEALSVHVRALEVRMQRSELLAANLANEDTPGFKARDLDFASEMKQLDSRFNVSGESETASGDVKYRLPMQPSQDGNTVDLAIEQTEFSQNAMDFQANLNFLSSTFRGLKQAIEGR